MQKLALGPSSVIYQLCSSYQPQFPHLQPRIQLMAHYLPNRYWILRPKVCCWALSHQLPGQPTNSWYVTHQLEFLVLLEESTTELRGHGPKWRGAGKEMFCIAEVATEILLTLPGDLNHV